MKIIRLLMLLLCTHIAHAVTAPYAIEINALVSSERTLHRHFVERSELRSDGRLSCDYHQRKKDEDWSLINPVGIVRRTIMTVPSDITRISTYPADNFNETKIFAGITAALLITDRKTTWFLQNNVEPALDIHYPRLFSSSLLTAADSYIIVGLGALYAGSLVMGSEKGQAAALLSYKSVAYSVLFTHIILKTATARKRPFDPLQGPQEVEEPYTRSQYDFFNFHRPYLTANTNATSFPSFHFTVWFASARVLQRVYDNAIIPYSLCALALIDGFGGHDHWLSDMAAGAMVGIAIGNVITNNFFQDGSSTTSLAPPKKRTPRYSLSLIPDRSRISLALRYHF